MNNQDWIERWHNGEIGFHQSEVNRYLCSWWESVERPLTRNVFVPLCGKSLDLLWLSQRCKSVTGIEVSEQAVKDFFEEHKLVPTVTSDDEFSYWKEGNISIICGDFFKLRKPVLFDTDFVYDRASLVALNKNMRHQYISQLLNLLPEKAQILLITMSYDQQAMSGPPFSVMPDEIRSHFENRYCFTNLFSGDVLSEYTKFADKGLKGLQESVLHLVPR